MRTDIELISNLDRPIVVDLREGLARDKLERLSPWFGRITAVAVALTAFAAYRNRKEIRKQVSAAVNKVPDLYQAVLEGTLPFAHVPILAVESREEAEKAFRKLSQNRGSNRFNVSLPQVQYMLPEGSAFIEEKAEVSPALVPGFSTVLTREIFSDPLSATDELPKEYYAVRITTRQFPQPN